ncbi:MAG: aldo/keto reductase [Clostridiales bacterium]|nr:aldo/keto reductase [Clostridiales bacterium]
MQYRTFPGIDKPVSILGFGAMRMPTKSAAPSDIDEEKAIAMIRHAIDNGVNYVDTAYVYHNSCSEGLLAKALKDGYREKVFLADKMPMWCAVKPEEGGLDAIFQRQLDRLETDVIDMYLLHNMNTPYWQMALDMNAVEWLQQKKAEGKVRYIGFSFHDTPEKFREILDAAPWDFCQIQLNFMDRDFQAGEEGLRYAASKGIPVVIMEPLKGGRLVNNIPPTVQEIWDSSPVQRTAPEWGLRWVANHPEVMCVLSGMNTIEQVEENLRIMKDAAPNSLTADEVALIEKAGDEYNNKIKASCTGCRYCLPCPMNIEIPRVINIYNQWHVFHDAIASKKYWELPDDRKPFNCVGCKACEGKCPQSLPIASVMREMTEIFQPEKLKK